MTLHRTECGAGNLQEQDVLRNIVVPCEENPLPSREVEVDEFQFQYSATERPNISNDTITISHHFAHDHLTKLSISHALTQSTKLCVFAERVMETVQSTKDLPELLASTGDCPRASELPYVAWEQTSLGRGPHSSCNFRFLLLSPKGI
jgi:uncharacterized Rmd1/YagE family protein